MLTAVLAVAAFVAGLTGAWSPCGFSMVSTLGEHARGRTMTFWACVAFVPGALVGGMLTFGALGAVGALLGGGDAALIAGAVVAAAAALAELAGLKIAPQIRRQVPEHWRRTWPLPLAAAGYGVLLGLGFTTFVLTFAVWALAGVSLAVGSVGTGVAIGLAFAAGRCLPVVVLAPHAQKPLGYRATELMAERPAILRTFRLADALALAVVAVALTAQTSHAATRAFVDRAADPSVAGAELAYDVPGTAPGVLRSGTGIFDVPGSERVAIGGGMLATVAGTRVTVAERATGTVRAAFDAPGVDAIAVSDAYVAVRRTRGSRGSRDTIEVAALADGARRTVATAQAPAQLGRPALDGARLVFHVAGRQESRIDLVDLAATGDAARRTLRRDTRTTYANPSLLGDRLLFVQTTQYEQRLVLASVSGSARSAGRKLLAIAPAISADKGYTTDHGPHRPGIKRPRRLPKEGPAGTTTTLWTTALAADAAYVTRLRERGSSVRPALLRVPLSNPAA
ncbi:MAG TPA: hypothetical protein VN238_22570 [Solirubrobacteraceae bacterium]|nr:hypothetical protein [Solirubrobacteraceae bacterium]